MDKYVRSTQLGFRKNRSTHQPLFAIRRWMDYIEASQDKCVRTLLDWKKAFDKVHQQRMITALRRVGIPEKICNIIASIYKKPKFKVADKFLESTERRQFARIRQGCPFEPVSFRHFVDCYIWKHTCWKSNIPKWTYKRCLMERFAVCRCHPTCDENDTANEKDLMENRSRVTIL